VQFAAEIAERGRASIHFDVRSMNLGSGCHILGKTVPDISRRNKPWEGKPPRVENIVQVKKKVFS
jgi:hypothetical protein